MNHFFEKGHSEVSETVSSNCADSVILIPPPSTPDREKHLLIARLISKLLPTMQATT